MSPQEPTQSQGAYHLNGQSETKKNRNCSYKNMVRAIPIECFGK